MVGAFGFWAWWLWGLVVLLVFACCVLFISPRRTGGRIVLGHFQWVVTVIEALQKVYIPYRSRIEALLHPKLPTCSFL